MLDMFLTTAGIRINTAQSFSILFFGEGEQLDIQRVFCFDTEIECGQPRFALPLEKAPS